MWYFGDEILKIYGEGQTHLPLGVGQPLLNPAIDAFGVSSPTRHSKILATLPFHNPKIIKLVTEAHFQTPTKMASNAK